jgi:hypothetical protein
VLKKALSLILVAAIAVLSVPASAQTSYAPKTIWGQVPESLKPHVTTAVLQDASGNVLATVPAVGGSFTFPDVSPGTYTVVLHNSAGASMATSLPVVLPVAGVEQAIFPSDKLPAALLPAKGGITTAGWIAIGAAAVGITTAIVVVSDNDDGNASPSQ